LILEPEFKFLMDNYNKIISSKVQYTFSGYAVAQKKKLVTKKERCFALEKSIEYIEEKYGKEIKDDLTFDENDINILNKILKDIK
jgi:hypothetical protein